MRLENRRLVVGGGQSGNRRRLEMVGQRQCFSRAKARVLVVDRDIGTAQETAD